MTRAILIYIAVFMLGALFPFACAYYIAWGDIDDWSDVRFVSILFGFMVVVIFFVWRRP